MVCNYIVPLIDPELGFSFLLNGSLTLQNKQQKQYFLQSFLGQDGRKQIAAMCQQYHVRQLGIFGSVLRSDFSKKSDVDVAVVFERNGPDGSFAQFMGLKESLERFFGREVDLVSADKIRNPIFAREVQQAQEVIYAA